MPLHFFRKMPREKFTWWISRGMTIWHSCVFHPNNRDWNTCIYNKLPSICQVLFSVCQLQSNFLCFPSFSTNHPEDIYPSADSYNDGGCIYVSTYAYWKIDHIRKWIFSKTLKAFYSLWVEQNIALPISSHYLSKSIGIIKMWHHVGVNSRCNFFSTTIIIVR